ncbi:MAG: hypothetical protein V1661_01755, partial [bacterium]
NLFPYFLAYSCGHILACVLISKFGLLYLNPLPNYMEDRVRISGRIPLEKFNDEEKNRIVRWAFEKLGAKQITEAGTQKVGPHNGDIIREPENKLNTSEKKIDIKSFVNDKKPANDAQFVAVIAYYYRFEAPEESKKDFIISGDLNEAARLTDWNRFKKPAGTLNNVYGRSGYLDKVEYGKYKLNTVGENLVAMVLPGEESGKIIKKRKNNKTKGATKKRAKK